MILRGEGLFVWSDCARGHWKAPSVFKLVYFSSSCRAQVAKTLKCTKKWVSARKSTQERAKTHNLRFCVASRAAPYRSANPQPSKSARERARRGAGQKRGACGSAWESARRPCSWKRHKGQALCRALPRAPRFWPALLRALSRALLEGWGCCTSVGGRPIRNFCAKVRVCTLFGALSGIGRNPTFVHFNVCATWAPWLELKSIIINREQPALSPALEIHKDPVFTWCMDRPSTLHTVRCVQPD